MQDLGASGYFEHTAMKRIGNGRQAIPMIHPAKRLSGGDHALVLFSHELLQKGCGEIGQVDRSDQNTLVECGAEGGMDAAEGSAIGDDVFERGESEMGVSVRGSEDRDVSGDLADQATRAFEHCRISDFAVEMMWKQGFVPPHTSAVSAGQNIASKPGDVHEKIVTADLHDWNRMKSGFAFKLNILSLNCFILVMMLMTSVSAQTSASKRTVSTVRADYRTGRLIRTTVVVEPKAVEPKVVAPIEVGGLKPDAPISELVEESASKYGVDPVLVHSVIKAESNYNPNAVSPVGARGLMQLMPGTARQLGVHNSFNPKENIEGGVKYLKYLQEKFQDPALALAAYNAGEGAVAKYNNSIPPYRETQDYVVKVARNYRAGKAAELRQKQQQQPVAAVVAANPEPEQPKAPEYRKVQTYYDANGRLYMRTQ